MGDCLPPPRRDRRMEDSSCTHSSFPLGWYRTRQYGSEASSSSWSVCLRALIVPLKRASCESLLLSGTWDAIVPIPCIEANGAMGPDTRQLPRLAAISMLYSDGNPKGAIRAASPLAVSGIVPLLLPEAEERQRRASDTARHGLVPNPARGSFHLRRHFSGWDRSVCRQLWAPALGLVRPYGYEWSEDATMGPRVLLSKLEESPEIVSHDESGRHLGPGMAYTAIMVIVFRSMTTTLSDRGDSRCWGRAGGSHRWAALLAYGALLHHLALWS